MRPTGIRYPASDVARFPLTSTTSCALQQRSVGPMVLICVLGACVFHDGTGDGRPVRIRDSLLIRSDQPEATLGLCHR